MKQGLIFYFKIFYRTIIKMITIKLFYYQWRVFLIRFLKVKILTLLTDLIRDNLFNLLIN